MQTTNLPLQLNNVTGAAASGNAAQRANAASAGDATQFSAMLSSEMAQAQAKPSAPAPAPQAAAAQSPAAPKQEAAKPAQAEAPGQTDDAAAPQQAQSAAQDGAKASEGAKQADADKISDKTDDAADAAAQQQPLDAANAMLALMASLQHPAAKTAPTPTGIAKSFDALTGGAAKGKASDGKQLAALQAAMKSVSKDGAAAAGDARALAAGSAAAIGAGAVARNPLEAGAAFGADDKAALAGTNANAGAGASASADLSAALAGAAAKGEHKVSLEAADLSLQQARDAAQQAPQIQAPLTAALQAPQPAAFEAAQAASASDALSAQVGTDAWEDQVGQKVVYMIGNEEQTASLTLNPPDLGPMQVVLSVTNDQASVTFSSSHEEVRQALEEALPRLREMMSESGIALGNASVNAGMPDQRQAQQDQPSRRGGNNYSRTKGVDAVGGAADTPEPRATRTAILGDRGMVDTFA